MKTYIIVMTAAVASLLTIAVLGIVNYYTCFAYFLPHRAALIELAPQDILMEDHLQFIALPDGFSTATITWPTGPNVTITNLGSSLPAR